MSTYEAVARFNQLAGKVALPTGTKAWYDDLIRQFKYLESEIAEFVEGLEKRDIPNMMKEAADIVYVAEGLCYLIGGDPQAAMQEVIEQNLSKVTQTHDQAFDLCEKLSEKGQPHSYNTSDRGSFYVTRDSDSKIMKPEGMVPLSLEKCAPEPVSEFFIIVEDIEASKDIIEEQLKDYPGATAMVPADDEGLTEFATAALIGREYVVVEVRNCQMIGAFGADQEEKGEVHD